MKKMYYNKTLVVCEIRYDEEKKRYSWMMQDSDGNIHWKNSNINSENGKTFLENELKKIHLDLDSIMNAQGMFINVCIKDDNIYIKNRGKDFLDKSSQSIEEVLDDFKNVKVKLTDNHVKHLEQRVESLEKQIENWKELVKFLQEKLDNLYFKKV